MSFQYHIFCLEQIAFTYPCSGAAERLTGAAERLTGAAERLTGAAERLTVAGKRRWFP